METDRELIEAALRARERAYAPYSGFSVGAALLGADGIIYEGCNIENASYSVTNCAERTALFAAVAAGCRDFTRIAVVGGERGPLRDYCPPCGTCRQALAEFADPGTFTVILAKSPLEYQAFTLAELLPMGYQLDPRRREPAGGTK